MGNKGKSTIGIIYRNTADWTGGAYYVLNLVKSFTLLPAEKKPEVVVFVTDKKDFEWLKNQSGYTQLQVVIIPREIRYSSFQRLCNKISRMLTGNNLVEKRYMGKLDILYPYSYDYFFDLVKNKVYWIPDFQEHYYPAFFSKEEVNSRKMFQSHVAKGNLPVVFSSHAVKNDFEKIYPTHSCPTHVLNFASFHTHGEMPSKETICKKYNLPDVYFYSPNQFWAHKNHICVLEALLQLKKKGEEVVVAFSGKEEDYRNPDYFTSLKQKVSEYALENHVRFLGFIDRADVFVLMKYAAAVIQPSLFEGWSTVAEDCKSVNGFLLASDLPVHREQLNSNVKFFDPHAPETLAAHIQWVLDTKPVPEVKDYKENIQRFALNFIELVSSMKQSSAL